MNKVLHTYGLFASAGIFAVAAWTSVSAYSGGSIPGAHGTSGSVMVPLAIACFIMAIHCLVRIVKEVR